MLGILFTICGGLTHLNHGRADCTVAQDFNSNFLGNAGAFSKEQTFTESYHLSRKVQVNGNLHAQCLATATDMCCARCYVHEHGLSNSKGLSISANHECTLVLLNGYVRTAEWRVKIRAACACFVTNE